MKALSTFPRFKSKPPTVHMMVDGVMNRNAEVAVLTAECICVWADIEFSHGALLAAMLHTTDPNVTVAMYLSLSSAHTRSVVLGAVATTLSAKELDLYNAVMFLVKSAYAERNKLAHWCWGYCEELEGGLVLIDPTYRMHFLSQNFSKPHKAVPLDLRHVFLVTPTDVEHILQRLTPVREYLSLLGGALWRENSESDRAQLRQKLSGEPAIRKLLDRQNNKRLQQNEEFLQQKAAQAPATRRPSSKQRRDDASVRAVKKKGGA